MEYVGDVICWAYQITSNIIQLAVHPWTVHNDLTQVTRDPGSAETVPAKKHLGAAPRGSISGGIRYHFEDLLSRLLVKPGYEWGYLKRCCGIETIIWRYQINQTGKTNAIKHTHHL